MQPLPFWVMYTATHKRSVQYKRCATAEQANALVAWLRTGANGNCYRSAYVYYCNTAHGSAQVRA